MKTISLGLLRAAYPDLKSEQILSLQEIIVEKLGIEVLDGLESGTEIILEGARSVKDGQTVEVITL